MYRFALSSVVQTWAVLMRPDLEMSWDFITFCFKM